MIRANRSPKIAAFVALVSLGALLFFQNCSRTPLERPTEVFTLASTGKTAWCLKDDLLGYTVETYYARNLNVLPWIGSFSVDSDADGLPDGVEASLGFNPVDPYSRSGALDRVCYNSGNNTKDCPSVPTACSSTPNALGISECDLKALELDLITGHPDQGLDTDKDGIPDYFEILSGISPAIYDSAQDPDHDNYLNQDEILRGSNPFFGDPNTDPKLLMQTHAEKITGPDASSCAGEAWEFSIDNVQFAPNAVSYTSSVDSGVSLSHGAGENVIAVVIKLRPKAGVSGNARLFYQAFVINAKTENLPFDTNSFTAAGEVLP